MIGKINEAVEFLKPYLAGKQPVGLVLGSGLGELVEDFQASEAIPYRDIPYFPRPTVPGHAGNLVLGKLAGRDVVALQGRFHYYEGYKMGEVTFAIRVLGMLGIKDLIITNAAGGVNREFTPGDLMVITDQINLLGVNPLRGEHHPEFGPRFPDMTRSYTPELRRLAEEVAKEQGISCQKGVYAAFCGPSYETPAEIRMADRMGADAVGMSTVPEVTAAAQMGIRVLGISCITNYAAGVSPEPLSHEEVMETADQVKEDFKKFLKEIIGRME
ncbi:MAG: purine-nucleoside phosphorylase [Halanaerobium sp.]|nr:purine-nucleoside phosphorylase [Halanaerobium sp.]